MPWNFDQGERMKLQWIGTADHCVQRHKPDSESIA